MGLALDESKEGDKTYNVGGINFVVAERDSAYIGESGGLVVDYSNDMWGKGFSITRAGQTCC